VAVGICEGVRALAPEGVLRGLGDPTAGGLGDREKPFDVGGPADLVRERAAAEALAVGGDADVLGQKAPREPRDRKCADLEEDDVALAGGRCLPADSVFLEGAGAREVVDAQSDKGDARLKGGFGRSRSSLHHEASQVDVSLGLSSYRNAWRARP